MITVALFDGREGMFNNKSAWLLAMMIISVEARDTMKIKLIMRIIVIILVILILFPYLAYANSSWRWISRYRPFDILPAVVIMTLVVEIFMITRLGKVKNLIIASIVISVANVASFVVPYLWLHLGRNELGIPGHEHFELLINNWPTYNVGLMYLLLTLVIEVPIVYILLKKYCTNQEKLLKAIAMANIVTTILVAVVERIISYGEW